MSIPPDIKADADAKLRAYCEGKIPVQVRDKLRLEVTWRGSAATIAEHRPYFLDEAQWTESPIARFAFDEVSRQWSLYCRDRNQRWHLFEPRPSATDLAKLIREVEQDKTGIFWG